MSKNSHSRQRYLSGTGGFTLIEILISMAIGMVLLFATLSIFDTTNAARAKLEKTNEVFQTGVFALGTVQSDIKLAGFYGEGAAAGALPSAVPNPCSTTAADWLAALPLAVQGWIAGDSGIPACVPAASLVPDSSVLVVRRAATCTVGSSNCSDGASGTPMIQVSQCSDNAASVQTGTMQSNLTLNALDCSARAPIRQFHTRIYYLDRNNVPGDGIPTLKRLDLRDGGFTSVTVAQGVEQMRLVYGLDTAGDDGVADEWTSDPATANACADTSCAISNWSDVVEVKANFLVRGTNRETGYINNRAYLVGDLNIAAPADSYRRNVISAAIRVVNVAGAREI